MWTDARVGIGTKSYLFRVVAGGANIDVGVVAVWCELKATCAGLACRPRERFNLGGLEKMVASASMATWIVFWGSAAVAGYLAVDWTFNKLDPDVWPSIWD